MNRFEVDTPRIRIEAPIGFVWEILTDVEKYGEWNRFTPQARTDFTIGSPAHLLVRMGKAKMQITETVCAFEYPRLIAWRKTFGARWLLHAVREQHLETVSETTCQYHNTDRLTGMLAPLVFLCFGGYMRRGFTDVGDGLRRYSEAKFTTTRPGADLGSLPS
ncbi:MAG: SRPBCC domain-containing protein [Bryobacterales bacterium]|nr:SRPBCC domain-containing protein [Bryobacterales bacterium]